MRRFDAFKFRQLSPSDHAVVKKWSRAMLAIYASLALVGVALAYASSGRPTPDNVVHASSGFVAFDHVR